MAEPPELELHDDAARADAFRRGDRALLAELYRAYAPSVEALARHGFTFTSQGATMRFTGYSEPFTLSEVTQDIFLRAFRREARHGWDSARPWRPYLMALGRNLILDRLRREQNEARYITPLASVVEEGGEQEALDRLSAKSASERPSPEDRAHGKQLQSIIASFMEGLDAIDQRVIHEHLMGGRTQTEMAEALGESRNDVRKRIRLIREGMLRHLKSHGAIPSLDAGEVFSMFSLVLCCQGGAS